MFNVIYNNILPIGEILKISGGNLGMMLIGVRLEIFVVDGGWLEVCYS